ncbi:MAG: PstS family phosphate ABC transporter substrate-binding protein, partial [Coleofasciculus sp. S288]|nr:PstS family phosphate ABC transporter substrate-binding protein [Coleofasciculus sp. S288]
LTPHPTLPRGSGTGIKMVLDGQLSFSQSSRPILNSEYKRAASRGIKLKQVPVALDGIAVVVHPSLNIQGLTLDQFKGIYNGQITNWSQIGGPNLNITPYSSPKGSGGTEILKEEILGEQAFGENVIHIKTPTEALNKVGQPQNNQGELGGIYFASASNLIGQCTVKPLPISRDLGGKFVPPYQGSLVSRENCPAQRNQLNVEAIQNGEYPLIRRLFMVVKQDGQVDQQVGEAYVRLLLTEEGQRLIKEAGFVPIRSF